MLSSVRGWAAEGRLPGSLARCDVDVLGGASSPWGARELLHRAAQFSIQLSFGQGQTLGTGPSISPYAKFQLQMSHTCADIIWRKSVTFCLTHPVLPIKSVSQLMTFTPQRNLSQLLAVVLHIFPLLSLSCILQCLFMWLTNDTCFRCSSRNANVFVFVSYSVGLHIRWGSFLFTIGLLNRSGWLYYCPCCFSTTVCLLWHYS